MRRILRALPLAALAVPLAVLASAGAQTVRADAEAGRSVLTDADQPRITVVESVRLTAVVDAVDKPTRTVTLRYADGGSEEIVAGPEVRNFDQIAVGDTVYTELHRLTNIYARPPLSGASVSQGSSITRAPLGEKPAGTAVVTTEVAAVVEEVDQDRRTIALRGPQGRTRTVQVAPDVRGLETIKAGDEVVVRQTEALAISVVK